MLNLFNPSVYKNTVPFLVTILLFLATAKAQDSKVSYGFKADTVRVKAGETFSNMFWIANSTNEQVKLVAAGNPTQGKIGLLRLPETITLQVNEKRSFPLKYMADQQTIRKGLQDIEIRLQDASGLIPIQKKAIFYALLENQQGVFIDTDQPEIYLDQITNQARVMIRIYNNGLIPVNFRLELLQVPEGLEFIGETRNLTLEAGSQQNVPFIAKNTLKNTALADFSVTINALDIENKQLATKHLRIMSVSSDRRLSITQSPFYQNRPNTIALRYMNVSNSLSSYQLEGNGRYSFGDSHMINYQLAANFFSHPDQGGINLSDSYVDYQHKKWGLKVGSIYENLDFNMNGRGIKATAQLGNKRSISVYGLDNNYLLYSSFNPNQQKFGNTFAFSYKEDNVDTTNKSVLLLRSHNLMTGLNTTLLSSTFNIKLDGDQKLGFEGGLSERRLIDHDAKTKLGTAFGVNYSHSFEKFSIYSNNYYSSPYYGGLRIGLLQLENSAQYTFRKNENLSVRFNYMNNRPKMLSYIDHELFSATNNYGNTTFELGYGTRIGHLNVNIRPYYFHQHMNINGPSGSNVQGWKSSSIRTRFNLSYSNNHHDISFDSDNGYTFKNTSQRPPSPFFSSRMNLNYRHQVVGFIASTQINSYYLSDALGISANPKYVIYNFGPNTHFALFDKRLTVNCNAMYNYYGYTRSHNYSVNGNMRWLLKGDWAISGDIYYGLSKQNSYKYNPAIGLEQQSSLVIANDYSYSNRQFRLGIEKSFGSTGARAKQMQLSYFEDLNGNGQHDNGESFAKDLLVMIDGLAAITNEKGTVRFTGKANKAYSVSVINNKGWTVLVPTEIFLRKNIKQEIPLVKTQRLTGSLNYIADKYAQLKPSLSGVRINAETSNGQRFSTTTDEKGNFSFYLPENKYTVQVETKGLYFSVLNQNQEVDVKQNRPLPALVFEYKDEHQKIEVIKFK